jgi:uncharacterized Zn finger protein
MSLKGKRELNARLKALRTVFKPIGKAWGKSAVEESRSRIPVKTGKLKRSVRVTSSTQKKVRVGAFYTAYFVDAGPKTHTITSKRFKAVSFPGREGQTIYARKVHHRGYRARPFRQRAAEEAMRKNPMAATVIEQWNRAA